MRSVRVRILASYVILLAAASVVSVFVARQVLIVRLDDRIQDDLAQEVREFRTLAVEGTDPATGRPFGDDVDRIFGVYLSRNVPGEGEELITIPRQGRVRYQRSERAEYVIEEPYLSQWRTLESDERGEIDTPAGPAEYVAVPVKVDGRPLGAFVVAVFTQGERDEVAEVVRIVAAVSGGVLLLASVIAFLLAGRVLAPLRGLRDAVRSITATDLTQRIAVDGQRRDRASWATPSTTCSTGSTTRSRASASSSATPATSSAPRSPIIRGHLELLAAGQEDPSERARDDRRRHRRARSDEPVRRRPAAAGQGGATRLPLVRDRRRRTSSPDELLAQGAQPRAARPGRSRSPRRGADRRRSRNASPRR